MKRVACFVAMLSLVGSLLGCSYMEDGITRRMNFSDPVSRSYAVSPLTIEVEDVSITYMEKGEGPWVILIHGGVIPRSVAKSFTMTPFADVSSLFVGYVPLAQSTLHSGAFATADTWNYNIDALADSGFRVVALDLPGFGGSDKPDIAYELEDFVIYLDGFMMAKGIDKASLVGHGLGGEVAILYTLEHPDKVEKLVLVDSFGAYQGHSPLNLPRWAGIRRWQKEKAAKINIYYPTLRKILGNWDKPADWAFKNSASQQIANAGFDGRTNVIVNREGKSGEFLEAVTDYKLEAITSADNQKEVRATHLALLETRRKDLAKRLPEIQVPVLVVRGYYDSVVNAEETRYMVYAIPRSSHITYEYSGHYPMVEESQKFNEDLVHFLTGSLPIVASGD